MILSGSRVESVFRSYQIIKVFGSKFIRDMSKVFIWMDFICIEYIKFVNKY